MSYKLVIVESPAKTGSFEKALGAGYKCLASFGHIRELKKLTDIDREHQYKPTYVNSGSKLKQITKLKDAAKKAEQVLLATDDDKEGEAIAWHLCQVLKLPVATTPRLIFHEVTSNAIRSAAANPSVINMDKVHAAQARQVLDLLVGFQISPLLWKEFGGQLALSAGRCQTPALRLVVENQDEIDKCPGTIAYTTTGYFTNKTLPFVLNHQHESEEEMAGFLEETVNSEHKHILNIDKTTTGTKNPPKPFTTSAMQQAANTEHRISPKEAMSICQKLYEAGLITYMRTDSRTYSKDFVETAKDFICKKYGCENIRTDIASLTVRQGDSKAKGKAKTKAAGSNKGSSAQEAHEAIRPTDVKKESLSTEKWSPKERKIYSMVWRNTVESCMKPCLTTGVVATVTAPHDLQYRISQEEITDPGWKLVAGYEKENPSYRFLVAARASCPKEVIYTKITSRLGVKDTKGHYTEARLVQLLEEKGIGRPSTFSSLVDKIQDRGYVKRGDVEGKLHKGTEFELVGVELTESVVEKKFGGEKNKLILQPLGAMVWDFLKKNCGSLFDYEYTKNMENDLDLIERGEKVWHSLCSACDDEIRRITGEATLAIAEKGGARAGGGTDIKIDDTHTYTVTKYGPAVYSIVDGKKVYKSARKNLDVMDIRSGKLSVDDIIDECKSTGRNLGNYEGIPVLLKSGKYGMYVQWGEKNVSVKKLGKNEGRITMESVVPLLVESKEEKQFRQLNAEYSVRVGKSPYVYYKTAKMKRPQFFALKGFDEDPFTCDESVLSAWLAIKHKIELKI